MSGKPATFGCFSCVKPDPVVDSRTVMIAVPGGFPRTRADILVPEVRFSGSLAGRTPGMSLYGKNGRNDYFYLVQGLTLFHARIAEPGQRR
jgi:hypothetical protein